MKIGIVEVSSGFGNVPNTFVLRAVYDSKETLYGSSTTGWNHHFTVRVPDGWVIEPDGYGEPSLWDQDGNLVDLCEKKGDWFLFRVNNGVSAFGGRYVECPIV